MCAWALRGQEPFHRRLAFDLGDVGIGQLTNSLELGCDCLGNIHYFDAILNNSKGAL
jgi:primary-amine oxidase